MADRERTDEAGFRVRRPRLVGWPLHHSGLSETGYIRAEASFGVVNPLKIKRSTQNRVIVLDQVETPEARAQRMSSGVLFTLILRMMFLRCT